MGVQMVFPGEEPIVDFFRIQEAKIVKFHFPPVN